MRLGGGGQTGHGLRGKRESHADIAGIGSLLASGTRTGASTSGGGFFNILHNSVIWYIFVQIKNPEEERVAPRSPVVSEFQKFNSDFYSETFEEKFPMFHLLRIFGF